jgi:type III secretion protein N (ATPase)
MLAERLSSLSRRLEKAQLHKPQGRVTAVQGPTIRAGLGNVAIGDLCKIIGSEESSLMAEVSGLHGAEAFLSPFGPTTGIRVGARVVANTEKLTIPVGEQMLGRVVDVLGNPIDDLGIVKGVAYPQMIKADAPPAMSRPLISEVLTTGLRAIDGCLTMGKGQRMAIFGSPGAGKSTLLAAIARHTDADVVVIGLVGERGREVREFVERDLSSDKREKVIVVTSTSDRPPVERALCAQSATAIAEYFRDRGKSVLLMVDSLTRTARALREVGLSAGEAPTRRGYPASVYPALPALIERAGRSERGDITAIYTVLVENDGQGDPIAEEVKSLTDGHIVLSPKLADAGHYPAIDMLQSLSRIMDKVTRGKDMQSARQMRAHLAKYAEVELLLQIGEYTAELDLAADAAIAAMPKILEFLQQGVDEHSTLLKTRTSLNRAQT